MAHVYCYQLGSRDCYKIGRTKGLPGQRMPGFATGSPAKPVLYRAIATEYPSELENYIHKLLDHKRAENGEIFYVSAKELDARVDEAVAFVEQSQPLVREANKLRRNPPNQATAACSPEMHGIYKRLRELHQQNYLIEKEIEFLESKVQVEIGDNCGVTAVFSWKWTDNWQIDVKRLQREREQLYKQLFEEFKRNIGCRKFRLLRLDLTKKD